MSLLYKKKEDTTITVDVEMEKGFVNFTFWSDCGKFGTDEIIDIHDLEAYELLDALRMYEEFKENNK